MLYFSNPILCPERKGTLLNRSGHLFNKFIYINLTSNKQICISETFTLQSELFV